MELSPKAAKCILGLIYLRMPFSSVLLVYVCDPGSPMAGPVGREKDFMGGDGVSEGTQWTK